MPDRSLCESTVLQSTVLEVLLATMCRWAGTRITRGSMGARGRRGVGLGHHGVRRTGEDVAASGLIVRECVTVKLVTATTGVPTP